MALRSTIYKLALDVADIDRGYYANHALTLARHPSETDERMMVRVLAFALNAREALEFGKGLSSDDEPALWERDLTGRILHWIDVGLPEERVLRRACGRADAVTLYLYGGGKTVEMWWSQNKEALAKQEKLQVIAVAAESSKLLASLAERTFDLQCMVQDGETWISGASDRFSIKATTLQARAERD